MAKRLIHNLFKPITSVRRRIIVSVAFLYLLGALTTSIWIYIDVRHEVSELLDAELVQQSRTLASMLKYVEDPGTVITVPTLQDAGGYERELGFRYETMNGDLIAFNSSTLGEADFGFELGLSEHEVSGEVWHGFGTVDEALGTRLLVFQSDKFRDELSVNVVLEALIPVAVIFPITIWLGWVFINAHFGGLKTLASQLKKRKLDDFSPVDVEGDTDEVRDITHGMNHYIARVRESLAREKRFTADAAHELKTPVAALRASLQSSYPNVSKEQVDNALASADRLERIVRQLLELSRAEQAPAPTVELNLAKTLRTLIAEVYEAFEARSLSIELDIADEVWFAIHEDAWHSIVTSLIDNVLQYSVPGSEVRILLKEKQLEVTNQFDEKTQIETSRLTERFYRGKHMDILGSGIGLSIVEALAQQARMTLNISTDQDLFKVTLAW